MLKKIFLLLGKALFLLIALLIVIGVVFVNFSPEFGGNHTDNDLVRYENTGHFKEGIFENITPADMTMTFDDVMTLLGKYWEGTPNSKPNPVPSIDKVSQSSLSVADSVTQLVWFGHSAFLLQIDGFTVLLDPMLGDTPSPHPLLGTQRYQKELPINIDDLPQIDVMIISHDHYDHLDYNSILQLKDKTKAFYVPMGVGAHFKKWGIDSEAIHEMNWWETTSHESLEITFAPSRHFSGRGITDRSTTLWGSWIVKGSTENIYFSGDGGYGPHFKEIGKRYGPFDFAMMECGQYNELWKDIHMMPEETVQAAKDIQAKVFMPIHWGSFTLALHSWTDPIERVGKKASQLEMEMIHPRIGQIISKPFSDIRYQKKWWE